MKKIYVIGMVILILAIIIVGAIFVNDKITEAGKKYQIAKIEKYNYFVLKQDNKYGVIDRNGDITIEVDFDDIKIPNPEQALFICYKNEKVKVINNKKEELFKEFEKVEPIRLKNISSDLMYEKTVLKYKQDNKYGLIDFKGKKITEPIYEEIDSLKYKEGELVIKKDGKIGIINIKGKTLIENQYDSIEVDGYFTDKNGYNDAGYIVSNKTPDGFRHGYIKGKLKIKPQYNELARVVEFKENDNVFLICAQNGQYGLIKNGKNIIPNEYQSIRYDMQNKVFIIEKSKKYGIASIDGTVIVPVKFNQIDITGIYIYAQNGQGTTVFTSTGNEANIDTNISILNTESDNYRIRIDSADGTKYGVIDKNGKAIIEEKYNYLEYLYDNYFIASNESRKLGIVDNKDKAKIEIKYDLVQKIQGTNLIQATISENEKTEIYSQTMDKICEMSNAIIEINETYIKVYNGNEIKYFNLQGKELKNTEVYVNNKLFAYNKNNRWGFVDKEGKQVVDCKYDKVTEFNEYGFAAIKKDEKWGVINEQGEIVLEPTYNLNNELAPSFINKYYKVVYGFGEFYYTGE